MVKVQFMCASSCICLQSIMCVPRVMAMLSGVPMPYLGVSPGFSDGRVWFLCDIHGLNIPYDLCHTNIDPVAAV